MIYAALYVSRAVRPFSDAHLAELLQVARRNNDRRGITGRLVYAAHGGVTGTFAQWIEGEDWRVRDLLYGAILRDGRHAIVGYPFEGPIGARAFGSWTMEFEKLPSEDALSEEIERLTRLARDLRPSKRREEARAKTVRTIRLDA